MRSKKWLRQTSMTGFLLLAAAGESIAQSATIVVTRELSFGNITAATTLAYSSANAAAFEIQFPNYTQSASMALTFVLPTNLTDLAGNNLPVSFAANSAAYSVGTNSVSAATAFNPSTGLSGTLGQTAHTDYFWLGATVTPPKNFVASDYAGEVTVNVDVTVGTEHYVSSQVITITATLQGNISLSVSGSLDFGLMVAGTTPPTLSALAGGAPLITATGVRNNKSIVTYSSTVALSDGNGHTLDFTSSLYGSAKNNQAKAVPIASGSALKTGRGVTVYYFWLGGSISAVLIGQAPGKYSGNFIITVVQ